MIHTLQNLRKVKLSNTMQQFYTFWGMVLWATIGTILKLIFIAYGHVKDR